MNIRGFEQIFVKPGALMGERYVKFQKFLADFFFPEIVRMHGIPKTITFDKDTRILGHFLRNLWKKIGTKL